MPHAQVTNTWLIQPTAPAWVSTALLADVDPRSGAFSLVYPLDGSEVVKLVREPGALDYLLFCRDHGQACSAFPVVYELLDEQVRELETGLDYTVVRMERLRDVGVMFEQLARTYAQHWAALAEVPDDVTRTTRAFLALSQELSQQGYDEVSQGLMMLASHVPQYQWRGDLANADNWMARGGDIVMADAVYHVNSDPD